MKSAPTTRFFRQCGLSLIELMVAMAISMTVLGGVVQVLIISKSNFITERELAGLQENARFALSYLTDEIRMAGYTACARRTLYFANSINGSNGNWYLDGTGLQGFEYDAGVNTFPIEFRADVAADTDALVVRRGESTGLRVSGNHNPNSAQLPLNKEHAFKPGTIMMIAAPDCMQVGVFQLSGPTNINNNAELMVHNTGTGSPGNCTKSLAGNFSCATVGNAVAAAYPNGSAVMEMRSEAYYVGVSSTDATVPALFRERMLLNTSTDSIYTAAEELVQGVENMQLRYGVDNVGNDGVADQYLQADDAAINWDRVVSVRVSLRMRSVYPVYNEPVDFGDFEGVADTDGSDRFMRQIVTTTIKVRNR